MKFQEIQEACWTGYRQAGMKKKGDRQVPNCVPVAEVKTGPEITGRDLLFKAAAMAMRDAGREGITLDYDQAIKQASRIYGIPYQPSELPRLLAQRAEIDRQLALLKQGKQVAKQRRQAKRAPTPAGTDEYWRTHALPTDRIKPATKTLEEATDIFMDNAARDMMAVLSMMAVGFGYGIYVKIRNKLDRYQGYQIVAALEDKGVTMNRATYEKVKPVLDQFKQALRDDDGAEAKALAKRIEQMVVMGKLSAPEPQAADTAVAAKERELQEDLKKWFKEKWVRFGPDGKIRGDCARGSSKEGKPKCLPQAKAHALGKKGRASAAARKRREDPNPERKGPARNVATKVKEQHDWDDADEFGMPGSEFFPEKQPRGHYKVYYMTATDHKLMGRYATQDEAEQRVRELKADYPDNQFIVFASQRGMAEVKEQYTDDDDWYDDADEFGMPGSEFFPDDDRLRDGDYVRDRQDGEYGEIFRMSGDPSERRVRILDRDGKGWYISPERLVAVDRNDPDIMKYFGKQRHRDMDEAVTLDRNKVPDYPRDPATVKARTDTAKAILSDPRSDADSRKQASAILAGLKQIDEKQDACYRKVKSRYKVWPSAYASGALVQCRKKGAANWGNKKK